ncbi:hypothetical protein PSTT_16848 [Puccinia striiformis]|uniref:HAT C-terminal dimerisation domain-containing protein n=1 Tax=Puccinia striiformis TaxID=27350 RepID=A0A2S4UB11_9BASI|nr:hypothetical protein PSTT_16848 [Puccinia striiformis]
MARGGSRTSKAGSGNSTDQSQNPRRSSRVTTPLRSNTHISTPADSRRSLAAPPNPSAKKRPRQPSKNRPGNSQTPSAASVIQRDIAPTTDSLASQGPTEAYDYDQDSEIEIEKIESKSRKKKVDDDDDDNFSYVDDFFEPPFWKAGDPPGTSLNFKCKWCRLAKNNKGCKQRAKAKKAGHRLPETVAERLAREAQESQDSKQTKLTGFVPTNKFACRVLNQIIVIWQVRHALPWARIKDAELRAAFLYSNKDARLYSRRWAADEAKQLYAGLQKKVFEELDNLDTTFTLIHDVWTTKGNRFAFIGAAVTYIDHNWQFVVRHLALKMIPWKHKGELLARPIVNLLKKRKLHLKITQTTDSGSNNNTMARTMYELFDLEGQSTWDPATMHIRCLCHKLALIVNAGLRALNLKTLPPSKTKQSVLGFFPVLGKLPEVTEADEDESPDIPDPDPDVQEVNQPEGNQDEHDVEETYESDYGNADDEGTEFVSDSEIHPDDKEEMLEAASANSNLQQSQPATTQSGAAKHTKSAKLRKLTDQLDVFIKLITRSAAQRGLFEQTANTMGIKCLPLIAGYGIRWNIKYESHRRALLAQEVIDRILKEDQENVEKSRRKSRVRNSTANSTNVSQFEDITFSAGDWQDIQELNWELEVTPGIPVTLEESDADLLYVTYVTCHFQYTWEQLPWKELSSSFHESAHSPVPCSLLSVMIILPRIRTLTRTVLAALSPVSFIRL